MSHMKRLLDSINELQEMGISDPYTIACRLGVSVQLVEDGINTNAQLRQEMWKESVGLDLINRGEACW